MGKIFFLLGKSASGKDTVYEELLKDTSLGLIPVVGATTRPKREGEREGVEYFFVSEQDLKDFEAAGKLVEKRVYHTVYGDWTYATIDNGSVDLSKGNYLYIGTLESYAAVRDYFGCENVVPLYIETEDGLRLQRAIERERKQKDPGYAELCRRFLADSKDFSEENLEAAGISKRFSNDGSLHDCLSQVKEYINQMSVL